MSISEGNGALFKTVLHAPHFEALSSQNETAHYQLSSYSIRPSQENYPQKSKLHVCIPQKSCHGRHIG